MRIARREPEGLQPGTNACHSRCAASLKSNGYRDVALVIKRYGDGTSAIEIDHGRIRATTISGTNPPSTCFSHCNNGTRHEVATWRLLGLKMMP
jgi:hypothetical protein